MRNNSIKFPFTKLNIKDQFNSLKRMINISKREIGKETDRLNQLDQEKYLNKTFIKKIILEKKNRNINKNLLTKFTIFQIKNKKELNINNTNIKKENNKIIKNIPKLNFNPLKNKYIFLLKSITIILKIKKITTIIIKRKYILIEVVKIKY